MSSIVIPIQKKNNFIEFFPDELPQDFNDLSDILRAEFAPLTAWKSSAVSFHPIMLQLYLCYG